MLADAVAGSGQHAEARSLVERAGATARASQVSELRMAAEVAAARLSLREASPADARILLSSLRGVSERAAAAGFALVDFEARVAAGELELRSGDAVAGRRQLESLRD